MSTATTFRVATCNADKALDADDARRVVALAVGAADVVLWQEVETRGHFDAIRKVSGWATYWPGGVDKAGGPKPIAKAPANASPISWRTSRFESIHQNKKLLFRGKPGVSFHRYATNVALRDRQPGGLVTGFQDSHQVAQAFTSHPERRPTWVKADRIIEARTQTILRSRGAVIGGADFNRDKYAPKDTTGVWASHGTYGDKRYDTLYFDGLVEQVGAAKRIANPGDHDILVATFRRLAPTPPKPKPTKPSKPAPTPTGANKVIPIAKKEVGYHEGRDKGGNWNNHQKYSAAVPGLEWSQNQAWCATFVSWLALKSGYSGLFPKTASCDVAWAWFKARGRTSEYPAIGAQVFFGTVGDKQHTGLVVRYDETYVWHIDGNTNTSGSSQGDGVYEVRHRRRDAWVQGYGYPAYPNGIVSADPNWKHGTPKGASA